MHDIRAIRENPQAYAAALSRRPTVDGASEIAAIMALDEKVRAAILRKQEAEQARNAKSKEIGKAKASKDEALAQTLMADVAAAKQTIEDAGKQEADATRDRDDLLARLPNVPLEDVPKAPTNTPMSCSAPWASRASSTTPRKTTPISARRWA